MVENIFGFLQGIGFHHPLHPAMTHIPMGMIMGAVAFRIVSLIPRFKYLAKTGYHCVIFGLLGMIPTALTGLLDWQHIYSGKWEFLIIFKMILAVALTAVMILIAVKDNPENPKFDNTTFLYLFAVLICIGLGFAGGELTHQLLQAALNSSS